jgi:hypothetical protein
MLTSSSLSAPHFIFREMRAKHNVQADSYSCATLTRRYQLVLTYHGILDRI